jgi:epoxyqueuosine reductase QueG
LVNRGIQSLSAGVDKGVDLKNTIAEQQSSLVKALKKAGASLVGFGDISVLGTELARKYPVAISLVIKYDEPIVERLHIDEDAFHQHLVALNAPLKRLISIAENLLSKWGYGCGAMPISFLVESNDQLRKLKTFSHKAAATCAGLGWIGKSSLLVTPEYGPRVKLGTVLTDAPFKTVEPIVKDRCKGCTLCVKACPYGSIHNINWERGLSRDKLLDAYLCNEKRLEYIPALGRKHSCGLCLQACKIGK